MTNPLDWAGRGNGRGQEKEGEWTGCGNGGKAVQAEDSTCERPGLSGVTFGGRGSRRAVMGSEASTQGTRSQRA